MYPSLSDMILDVTGIYIPMPVQTFGFFLALAFLSGSLILFNGFKRLERLGILKGAEKEVWVGKAPSILDIVGNAIFGFFLGYKLIYGILNYSSCVSDPQGTVLSWDGSIIGGIFLAAVLGFLKFYEQQKEALPEPVLKKVTVMPHEQVGDLIIVAAVSGIIGAKVLNHLEYWQDFLRDPIGSILSFSGLTFYGGLIGGSIAVIIFARLQKIPLRNLIDVAAPSVMIGYAVGRLGCHFAGDGCWGIVNTNVESLSFLPDWLWAYSYSNNVAQEGIQIANCEGKYCFELAEAVYPTAVYEFLMGSGITAFLLAIRSKFKIPGLVFATYLMLNGVERFLIEAIRVNERYEILGFWPSLSQVVALGLISIGAFLFFWWSKSSNKDSIATA